MVYLHNMLFIGKPVPFALAREPLCHLFCFSTRITFLKNLSVIYMGEQSTRWRQRMTCSREEAGGRFFGLSYFRWSSWAASSSILIYIY